MIDEAIAKTLGSDVLMGAKDDLIKTLEIQEKLARIGLKAPKLDVYWKELQVVVAELRARGAAAPAPPSPSRRAGL
jgi:sRNA-binding carbon storage regulator CsrA